jgi:ribosomal protein L29
MKKKEKVTLYNQDSAELVKQAAELRRKIDNQRLARYTKPSKNLREANGWRKKLAIILTYIRQKEIQHDK